MWCELLTRFTLDGVPWEKRAFADCFALKRWISHLIHASTAKFAFPGTRDARKSGFPLEQFLPNWLNEKTNTECLRPWMFFFFLDVLMELFYFNQQKNREPVDAAVPLPLVWGGRACSQVGSCLLVFIRLGLNIWQRAPFMCPLPGPTHQSLSRNMPLPRARSGFSPCRGIKAPRPFLIEAGGGGLINLIDTIFHFIL